MKTHLNDLFDKLEPEEGNKIDDKIQIDKNSKAQEIYENYQEYAEDIFDPSFEDRMYEPVLRDLNAKDITNFSILLKEKIQNKERPLPDIGGYINYLIKKSIDKTHTLFLPEKSNHIFYGIGALTKNKIIHIHGNAGNYLGEGMISSKIIAHGEISSSPGYKMQGGIIIIKNECPELLGVEMEGGEILVKGHPYSSRVLNNNYELLPNGYTRVTPKSENENTPE